MLPLKEYIGNPKITALVTLGHFGQWLPDSIYLRLLFRLKMGHKLNLKNPKTFNEKLQWLKLYDRQPQYTMMVDKYEVKDYVVKTIGEEYVIPTLGIWDSPEEIEWSRLPNRFVLKTTHGGGSEGVVICTDKNTFNVQNAVEKLKVSMKQDIYRYSKEWPYKNVRRRIIAEKYIDPVPGLNDLPDYKFFCFDGTVKALFVGTERQNTETDVKFDFFDSEFNLLPFRQGHDHAEKTPEKPANFELMKSLASKLSKGIPQVRVDLYDLGDKVLFGELTFSHFSGTVKFEPDEWDYKFGEWIKLPSNKTYNK